MIKTLKMNKIIVYKGFVLDQNRNHFPTLLISCVLCSIILFTFALIVSSIHQKKENSIIIKDPKQIDEKEQQQMEIHSNANRE